MFIEPSWNALVDRLKGMAAKRIYVTGEPDSGKTTLARFLCETFSVLKPTAFIDCDPGQSALHLPTTLSAGFYAQGSKEPQTVVSRFVGDISPQRKQTTILLSLYRLAEKMSDAGAECMIFDSSGFVKGAAGLEFQTAVIEMLHPDVVILLNHNDETDPLELVLQKFGSFVIEKIPVSQAIRPRSMPLRREKRENKYREYFQKSEIKVLDVNHLALCGSLPERFTVQNMRGRLLAFCDKEKFVIAMGIARSFYGNDKICICQIPDFDLANAAFLHFGDIFVNAQFKEELPGKRQTTKDKKDLKYENDRI